jgi:isopenicillin N synthase-like dioxygenase
MQISGHGIAQDVTDATLHSADRFFELPLDAKARRGTAAS